MSSSVRMQGEIKNCSKNDPVKEMFQPRLSNSLKNARECGVALEGPRWQTVVFSRARGFQAISVISFSVYMQGKIKNCPQDDPVHINVWSLPLGHFQRIHACGEWRGNAQGGEQQGFRALVGSRPFRSCRFRFACKARLILFQR